MRKLATIERVLAVNTHHNADMLELATIRGWQVVVRKEEFKVSEMVVFFEIDSWVPYEIAPFLSKGKEPKVYEGVKGERLRTVKLRGEVSQGLILPLSILDSYEKVYKDGSTVIVSKDTDGCAIQVPIEEGADVTELLNILKWEPEIATKLGGRVSGNFPSFIRKTDQERVQNCYRNMARLDNYQFGGINWTVEEKLDGCLVGSTLITTDKGEIPISEIVSNPTKYKVKSYDVDNEKIEFDLIVNVMKNLNDGKQWFRLTLEDDRIIEITGNHRVYLPALKCWRKVEDLSENDIFLIE